MTQARRIYTGRAEVHAEKLHPPKQDINHMPKLSHCMVDLETLGTRPGSILLSIGAVMFDPVAGIMGDTFYQNIKRSSCEAAGLTFDQATLDWWLKQNETAKGVLSVGTIALDAALARFNGFWANQGAKFIWSHGANFDEVLMGAAYRAVSLAPPWKYYDVMCSRTVTNMTAIRPDRSKGTHHNALDDARNQAQAIIDAYQRLRLAQREG